MIARRDVLKLAALAAPASFLGAEADRPVLAANTYIWTQMARLRGQQFEIKEIFSGTQQAGYRNIELTGSDLVPDRLPEIKALLRRCNLRPVAAYASGGTRGAGMGGYGPILHDELYARKAISFILETVPALRSLGIPILHVNPEPKPKRQSKSLEELDLQAKAMNRLGEALLKQGIRLAIHQHEPEMLNRARKWRHVLHNTDSKLVWFNLDVEWVFRGSEDPLTILKEAGHRIASLHIRNSNDKIRSEALGDGDIDYRAIAAYLREIKFTGPVVVELAYGKNTPVTRSLIDNLRVSLHYATEVFGSRT